MKFISNKTFFHFKIIRLRNISKIKKIINNKIKIKKKQKSYLKMNKIYKNNKIIK
jgi:hypothetical protein